jgi:hypothetical protein
LGNAWSRNLCEHKRPLSVRTYDDLRCCLARRPRACAGAKAEGQPGMEGVWSKSGQHPSDIRGCPEPSRVVVAQETFQHSGCGTRDFPTQWQESKKVKFAETNSSQTHSWPLVPEAIYRAVRSCPTFPSIIHFILSSRYCVLQTKTFNKDETPGTVPVHEYR